MKAAPVWADGNSHPWDNRAPVVLTASSNLFQVPAKAAAPPLPVEISLPSQDRPNPPKACGYVDLRLQGQSTPTIEVVHHASAQDALAQVATARWLDSGSEDEVVWGVLPEEPLPPQGPDPAALPIVRFLQTVETVEADGGVSWAPFQDAEGYLHV